MVYCQAFGCKNKPERKTAEKKHYFSFPHPEKEKQRCERWLHNIGTGYTIQTFTFNSNKKVCSEHFNPECYEEDKMAKMLNYTPKVRLKAGAIPTIFTHKVYNIINMNGDVASEKCSAASLKRLEEEEHSQVTIY